MIVIWLLCLGTVVVLFLGIVTFRLTKQDVAFGLLVLFFLLAGMAYFF